MNAIITIFREVWGLFVEDVSFTLGILACLAFGAFVVPRVIAGEHWRGPILFVALALMLFENIRRSARP